MDFGGAFTGLFFVLLAFYVGYASNRHVAESDRRLREALYQYRRWWQIEDGFDRQDRRYRSKRTFENQKLNLKIDEELAEIALERHFNKEEFLKLQLPEEQKRLERKCEEARLAVERATSNQ